MPDNFLESASLDSVGYENFYTEGENGESLGKNSAFFNSNEVQPSEGATVTGKPMSSHVAMAITGKDVKNGIFFGKENKVFGLPFKYGPLADPMGRVFQSTFETDSSCVAFIKFGIPKINKALFGKMSADASDTPSFGLNIYYGFRSSIDPTTNTQDQRLITFEPKMNQFMKYANASINEVYTLLDLPGLFSTDGYTDEEFENGFAFFCTKTSTITETVDNSYTTPDVIDKMNSDAALRRQNYQMYGTYGSIANDSGGTDAVSWLESIANTQLQKVAENIADSPIIGSVASAFMKSNKGTMGYYGQLWADSKTSDSFSLQFKFRSPYGSKYEIFRNCFFPFLLLHTAAIPKQDGRFSYQEPFMVMIDFPGWFRVNCGVIESLSWVKGGSNALFNVDGLPLEIEVTMNVKDLYPIQLSSENVTVMEYNWGLLSFLENMAGLTTAQAAYISNVQSFQNAIRTTMAQSDGSIMGNTKAYFNAHYRVAANKWNAAGGTVGGLIKNGVKREIRSRSYLGR